MKAKQISLASISTIRQSNWMRPALITLALLVFGVTGCQPHH